MLSTGSVILAGRWGGGLLSFPDHRHDNDGDDEEEDAFDDNVDVDGALLW